MQENVKLFVQDIKTYWKFIFLNHIQIAYFESGYTGEIQKLAEFHKIPNNEINHWIACARLGIIRPYKEPEVEFTYKPTICYYVGGGGCGRRVLHSNKSIQ